jgi:hypothetical protein
MIVFVRFRRRDHSEDIKAVKRVLDGCSTRQQRGGAAEGDAKFKNAALHAVFNDSGKGAFKTLQLFGRKKR